MNTFKYTLLATLFTALSCGDKATSTDQTITADEAETITITQEQFDLNNFSLGSFEKRSFPELVVTTGMIDVPPEYRAMVSAPMGGYVKTTHLLVGDKVKKGQALVTLENQEFVTLQQNYLEVFNQLDFLKLEYERQKTLHDENITSAKNYLKAKSDYEMARSTYNGLRKRLELLNISVQAVEAQEISTQATLYAPISGYVTEVNVSKGSYISPASGVLEIVNNEHIHLELNVFEKDILKIKEGQTIRFKIPEASNEAYSGKVHLVGTSIDEVNRTIEVHGHPDKEEGFLTGMFVSAEIITGNNEGMALASEGLVDIEGQYSGLQLLKKENDTYYFKEVPMTLGMRDDGHSEIKNAADFDATAQFLIKGAFNVLGN